MKNENKNYKLTNTEVNYTITSKNITELTPEDIKDVLGLSIADKTVTYNGKEQSLVVNGTIPTGVTVEYNNTFFTFKLIFYSLLQVRFNITPIF